MGDMDKLRREQRYHTVLPLVRTRQPGLIWINAHRIVFPPVIHLSDISSVRPKQTSCGGPEGA